MRLFNFSAVLCIFAAISSAPAEARYHREDPQQAVACEVFDFSCESSFQRGKFNPRRSRISRADPPASFYSWSASIARPARYIGGRLICAINVNAALAERGIRGTGSALAHSFDRWGSASAPVPGAVAVTNRRGGGHVAIVSRVENGRVYAWNPSTRGRGWKEVDYTNRRARYRVAGGF